MKPQNTNAYRKWKAVGDAEHTFHKARLRVYSFPAYICGKPFALFYECLLNYERYKGGYKLMHIKYHIIENLKP